MSRFRQPVKPQIMIHVYHSRSTNDYHGLLHRYKHCFTSEMIRKSGSYRQPEDACRFLLGKILLVEGLRSLGSDSNCLETLSVNDYNKPFIPGAAKFNISHAGEHVVCVFGEDEIGVDIEQVTDIDARDFSGCFTAAESTLIQNADDPRAMFFRLWTRKEAVVKANGTGLNTPLLSFNVIRDRVSLNGKDWTLREFDWYTGYSMCIAVSKAVSLDQINRVELPLGLTSHII